jgi:flagellar biosynthesis protein FlhF
MQDTIFKVKAELGSDAIILNTRRYKKGFFGLFGRKQVEILAALEESKPEKGKTLNELSSLKEMVREINNHLQLDSFTHDLTEDFRRLYTHFNYQGVDVNLSRKFIIGMKKGNSERQELENYLGNPQPIKVNSSRKVVALIGPTGVGKTTTIAKLAAKFTLDEGTKVGLVTADTYRVAAIQQLKTYSDIINLPLEVVYGDNDLPEIMENKYREYDLILIDTVGSSWNDQIQMGRLRSILKRDLIDEIHLVISINTKSNDILEIINNFSIFNPDKVILTKLDETATFGDIFNIRSKYNLPYSYITYGQDVPDDIKVAYPGLLIDYLMGDLHV